MSKLRPFNTTLYAFRQRVKSFAREAAIKLVSYETIYGETGERRESYIRKEVERSWGLA